MRPARAIERLAGTLAVALALSGGLLFAADKLDLNTATEQDLLKLPEMTEARAKAIIGYRKSSGEFIQVDELELIPQVKPIFGKIKDLVTAE